MPQTCTVCRHSARIEIERAMIAGAPLRDIAGRYNVSKTAVARHKVHILSDVKLNAEARDVARAGTIIRDVEEARARAERLYSAAENLLDDALTNTDGRMALQAIKSAVDILRVAREYLQLHGTVTGELLPSSIPIAPVTIVMPAVSIESSAPEPPTFRLALPIR